MDALPNDVKSIVYRYVRVELINDVNEEYRTRFAIHWSDTIPMFYDDSIKKCLANWRPLKYGTYCNIYSFKYINKAPIRNLPKNY